MRGKETKTLITRQSTRITPAHAGKSFGHAVRRGGARDHPRACGEKGKTSEKKATKEGSPPRMRGKGIYPCRVIPDVGITPAHAGKRRYAQPHDRQEWDHPRACGEKGQRPTAPRWVTGSPPRMRGKAPRTVLPLNGSRITPAHAGKSRPKINPFARKRDHPRACGEKMEKKSW